MKRCQVCGCDLKRTIFRRFCFDCQLEGQRRLVRAAAPIATDYIFLIRIWGRSEAPNWERLACDFRRAWVAAADLIGEPVPEGLVHLREQREQGE